MKLSYKDKSLLLLIAASLIILSVIFSFFSSLFFTSTFGSSSASKIIPKDSKQWLNLSRPLEISDLKDRVILLDFWNYACVGCVQSLPEIKKLEKQFGSKLLIIGVHSAKFNNEKDLAAVRKAVLKYDVSYPVINDSNLEIWNNFKINALPTFVLINPRGNIFKTYIGENELVKIKGDIKKLIDKFKFEINRNPLPVRPEKFISVKNILDFPTKLEYAADFFDNSHHLPAILIANTGNNKIIASSLSGNIIAKIGSGIAGFEDGDFDQASFKSPQGLIYQAGKIYLADTANNALREIDLKLGKVKTLVGSGNVGEKIITDNKPLEAKNIDLASPTDIEFFPDKNNIAIANSGTNQILSYNIKNQTISVLAGDGSEGILDGKYPKNSLAQTSDMSFFGHKLYFVDASSSSLRVLEEDGNVKTLIGNGLNFFGHQNGNKSVAKMQHPLGLIVDDTGAYISDSFNHTIRKYDFASNQIHDLSGMQKKGEGIGAASLTQFDEPDGIISVLGSFYVADSNNNRIVILNRGTFASEILNVMPPLKLPKEGFLQYLPNLEKSSDLTVKSDSEIVVKIKLADGWKINEDAPSFVNLLDLVKENEANLVASFDWHAIKSSDIKLPKLIVKKEYLLQGVIYFCQDKKNSLCRIKSYEQKIRAEKEQPNSVLEIDLSGYQK
jgi:thiol-disulfide isomerase/thioredoxin